MSVFVGCNGWVLFSTCLNVLVQCTAECVIVVFFLHTSQAMDHLMHAELCDPWTECAGEELRGACCKIRRWVLGVSFTHWNFLCGPFTLNSYHVIQNVSGKCVPMFALVTDTC